MRDTNALWSIRSSDANVSILESVMSSLQKLNFEQEDWARLLPMAESACNKECQHGRGIGLELQPHQMDY